MLSKCGGAAGANTFDTTEEAIALASATEYGVGSGIRSSHVTPVNRIMRGIEAGTVSINCFGMLNADACFGGFKQSGHGWKGGIADRGPA